MQACQTVPEIVNRSSVIYNGVKVPRVAHSALPFRPPTLLCLGRLQKQKGFDLALTAVASINQRFPDLRLVMAGDGPERTQLEQQVSKLHLKDAVKFIGWVSPEEVPALINTATVILMPSRWEGLPSVALQASVMARPIVAARVGGLPEIVLDGYTGLLIPPEDHQALANAITILLERPSMSVTLGQAARQRVQEVFSWQRCVDAYAAVYQTLARRASFNDVLGSTYAVD
jgi:glycogen(starch) synthase